MHGESKKNQSEKKHLLSSSKSNSKFKSKCHSKRNSKANNVDKPSWKSRIIHFLFHNELEELHKHIVIPSNAAKPNKQIISSTKITDSVTTRHINKTDKKPETGNADTHTHTNSNSNSKEFILNIAELRNCEIVSPFGETSDGGENGENETPIWKLWGQYQDTSSLSLYSDLIGEDNSDLKGEANFVLIDSLCGCYSVSCSSDDEERTFDGEFEIL